MIDLRSDTVTKPSSSMRKAMAEAEVGDDVLREDPTVIKLEQKAAELTGKEAALFTPSGTFANQLAIFTWIQPGNEVYVNENSHIVQHEAGASSHISGAFLRTILPADYSWLEWKDIQPRIRPYRNQHFPESTLICLENALADGTVQPVPSMETIHKNASELSINVHTDGARIFNAAAALNIDASEIACHTDSLMFCISKGLGAPVGSLLCGSRDFIEKAFYKRKIMGGGMRQAGVLAAAGLTAFKEELPRLKDDHEKAKELAEAFSLYSIFNVLTEDPQINMVFIELKNTSLEKEEKFLSILKAQGILTYPPENGIFRFVTHRDFTDEQLKLFLKLLPVIVEEMNKKK